MATLADFLTQTRAYIRDTGLYTTLTQTVVAGAQSLPLQSVAGIAAGQALTLDTQASGIQEIVQTAAASPVSGLSVNLAAPTLLTHEPGAIVSALAFDDTELSSLIQDAVQDYTLWRPNREPYTLQLVAGQATYQLPADWLRADAHSFWRAVHPFVTYPQDPWGYVDSFGAYVWPSVIGSDDPTGFTGGFTFRFYPNQTLLVDPAPTTAQSMGPFDYWAMQQVTATLSTIPAQDQAFVCRFAAAQAMRALAADRTKLEKYSLGLRALQIDNSKAPDHLMALAQQHEQIYDQRVRQRPYLTTDAQESVDRHPVPWPNELMGPSWY